MEKNRFTLERQEDEGSVMVGSTEYFFQLSYVNSVPIINWFNKPKNNEEAEKKIKVQLKKKK